MRLLFVFIHAGALHGEAMMDSRGFSARACRTSGRMYASSCAMENRERLGSGAPSL
jgi:hypothetical protein